MLTLSRGRDQRMGQLLLLGGRGITGLSEEWSDPKGILCLLVGLRIRSRSLTSILLFQMLAIKVRQLICYLPCNVYRKTCLRKRILRKDGQTERLEDGLIMKEMASLFCSLRTYTRANMSSRFILAVNPKSFIGRRPQEHTDHLLNNNISISLEKQPQT